MTQTAENRRDAAQILCAELGQSAACTPGDYPGAPNESIVQSHINIALLNVL